MQKSNDILNLLGIKIENGKIEVDTNKTKAFFENIQKSAKEQVENIEKGLQEGKLDLNESVGLKVKEQKIELDLNKTKSFFENLAKKASSFLETIDKEIEKINKNET